MNMGLLKVKKSAMTSILMGNFLQSCKNDGEKKMPKVLYERRRYSQHTFTMCIIFIIFTSFIGEGFGFSVFVAHAMVDNHRFLSVTSCPSVLQPTSQSLLVVLLDRSGSLTQGSSPTDPKGYSTSVTKALTDLWPGEMAVIPYNGDTTTLPIYGPVTLSDPIQRTDLKQKVQGALIGGDTPLEPAMQEALDLFHHLANPSGSRVIVITDGNPTGIGSNDGPHQEDAIRKNLIPQYCQQGIPVSAFGLTINLKTPDGQNANSLLSDIASGTGATYSNVVGPEDLGKQVISLFAEWQRLTFAQVSGQGSNFPVSIDTFAQQVSFVTFRSDSRYQITLIGPNNQVITTGVQKSTPADAHYEIDSMIISGPIQPGIYTINIGSDPNAQVYVLIHSPLQVQLVAPTVKTIAYADRSVQLEGEFLNGTDPIIPSAGDGVVIVARVTLLANGRPAGPTNDIVLTQQSNSPIFSGQTIVYNQPGKLLIELDGTYRNVPRQTSFTLQLLHPSPKPASTPCGVSCLEQRYGPPIIVILILLVLAALAAQAIILRQRARPKPYGYLTNGKLNGDVELERFRKPVISSRELENRGNFKFGGAKFELIFDKEGTAKIRTAAGNLAVVAIEVPGQSKPVAVNGKPVEIRPGKKIYVSGNRVASFETVAGRRWS
jgi:von Willebrand factor type A domain